MATTIQIKRGTGSAVPTGLSDGELAINLDNGKLYFGSGSNSINSFRFENLTAENYIVSSSVTNITTLNVSGSTTFGDSADDTHVFIGAITASGNISSSGNIYAVDYFDNGANISTIYSPIAGGSGIVTVGTVATGIWNGTVIASAYLDSDTAHLTTDQTFSGNKTFSAPITASSNISSSGNIIAVSMSADALSGDGSGLTNVTATADAGTYSSSLQILGNVTSSANISASGTITGNSIVGTLGTAAQTNITSVGTLSALTVSGDITAQGNIVGDDATDITNIESIFADNIVHDGDTDTKIAFGTNTVQIDAGGTTVFRSSVTGSTLENPHHFIFDTGSLALSGNGGSIGDIVKFGGSTTVAGGVYYLTNSGTWVAAQANAAGTATSSLAVALGTNSTTNGMCLRGFINPMTDPGAGTGNPLYLRASAAGRFITPAPSSTGDIVRILGYQYGTDLIYFNPSNDYIIHA